MNNAFCVCPYRAQVRTYVLAMEGLFGAAHNMTFLFAPLSGETAKQVRFSRNFAMVPRVMEIWAQGWREWMDGWVGGWIDHWRVAIASGRYVSGIDSPKDGHNECCAIGAVWP